MVCSFEVPFVETARRFCRGRIAERRGRAERVGGGGAVDAAVSRRARGDAPYRVTARTAMERLPYQRGGFIETALPLETNRGGRGATRPTTWRRITDGDRTPSLPQVIQPLTLQLQRQIHRAAACAHFAAFAARALDLRSARLPFEPGAISSRQVLRRISPSIPISYDTEGMPCSRRTLQSPSPAPAVTA